MAVKEILDKRVTDLGMTARAKDEVICHLAGLSVEAGYIRDLEGYVKDVYLRESKGIIGIGDHVAILHGKSDYVDHVGLTIRHTRDVVEWESYDEQSPDLFFLFVVPADPEGTKDHLKPIAEPAGKLGNDSVMMRLQTAKSYDELLEAFAWEHLCPCAGMKWE